MYKLLLCWRYLRTRYIALASIVSVTLGVATMIVVNSVMAGFTREMQQRIHGILSDVVVESHGLDGFPGAEWHMDKIRRVAGDYIAGMTPTVFVPALLQFQPYGTGTGITRQVTLIGIDSATHAQVSDFGRYLQHPANREQLSFDLRKGGYDTRDHQAGPDATDRGQMSEAGWTHRKFLADLLKHRPPPTAPSDDSNAGSTPSAPDKKFDPFGAQPHEAAAVFDPAKEQHHGLVMGIAIASYRASDGERFLVVPGDDVQVTVPRGSAGSQPKAANSSFTIVDFYESKMSEYDSNFVFVPMEHLQDLRGMIDPQGGARFVNSIQIKLKNQADGNLVRDKLRQAFTPQYYRVETWRDKQGPLLAAVQMETAILNVLLFMIIAVAGFGILAIFYMIVVEKTRDIGVLKALGAPSGGIMTIFLSYGLLLGIVGSGAGMIAGLLFVMYINNIADLLARVTGHEVFDPTIYYFQKIPTIVDPFTVAWIVAGAILIAVMASILPARRAARLHPVEALRYE